MISSEGKLFSNKKKRRKRVFHQGKFKKKTTTKNTRNELIYHFKAKQKNVLMEFKLQILIESKLLLKRAVVKFGLFIFNILILEKQFEKLKATKLNTEMFLFPISLFHPFLCFTLLLLSVPVTTIFTEHVSIPA